VAVVKQEIERGVYDSGKNAKKGSFYPSPSSPPGHFLRKNAKKGHFTIHDYTYYQLLAAGEYS
jgi:hypothetical protein